MSAHSSAGVFYGRLLTVHPAGNGFRWSAGELIILQQRVCVGLFSRGLAGAEVRSEAMRVRRLLVCGENNAHDNDDYM